MIGSSRSGSKDFQDVVDLYIQYPDIVDKLALLKGQNLKLQQLMILQMLLKQTCLHLGVKQY